MLVDLLHTNAKTFGKSITWRAVDLLLLPAHRPAVALAAAVGKVRRTLSPCALAARAAQVLPLLQARACLLHCVNVGLAPV